MPDSTIEQYNEHKKLHPESKREDIWLRMQIFWDNYNPIHTIPEFFRKIKYVISWIPVLWNDYQHDYAYLYIILKIKLQKMQKYYAQFNYPQQIYDPILDKLSREQKIYQQITECIKLIDYIDDSTLLIEKERKEFDEKWGEGVLWGDENRYLHTTYTNIHTEEDIKECTKQSMEMYKLEEERVKATWDKLHRILIKSNEWYY